MLLFEQTRTHTKGHPIKDVFYYGFLEKEEGGVIFEKEINIYAKDAILKRFQANETSIAVTQGKISALISESELVELQNSEATMYSKLASVQLNVSGLTENFSDLTTKYDTVTGQYSTLDAKVAEYKRGVDGLSANITAVNTKLTNDYSTTEAMNAAIKASVDGLSSTVSKTYATTENLTTAQETLRQQAQSYASDAQTSATKAAQDAAKAAQDEALKLANASTDEKLKSYSTTIEMNSAIKQSADSISLAVSESYVKNDTLKSYATTEAMNAAINVSANNITLKVESLGKTIEQKNGNFYGLDVPTTSNAPASGWNTEELKKQHNGDIYVQTTTGYTYRYFYGDSGLIIKFSENSQTEKVTFDYVKIYYDDNGTMKCAATLGGTDIAGATVYVPTQEFYVYWHTDGSYDSYYGFKIDSVTQGAGTKTGSAESLPGYTATALNKETYPESSHGSYGSNVNQLWKCTGPEVGRNKAFWQRIETVTKSEVNSIIEQSADSIRLQAKKIAWESDYSSMTSEGKLSCQDAAIYGNFTTKQPWNGTYKITELKEGVIKGYKGDTQTGLLDMSAYYSDDLCHVALKGFDYLHLQAGTSVLVEQSMTAKSITIEAGQKLYTDYIDSRVPGNNIELLADLNVGTTETPKKLNVIGNTIVHGIVVYNAMTYPNVVSASGTDLVITASNPITPAVGCYIRKKSSSSRRYKDHLAYMNESDVKDIYNLHPVYFKYKKGYLMEDDPDYQRSIPGFYAESVDEVYPEAVRYNYDGQPEDWDPKKLLPAVVRLVQLQKEDIDKMKKYSPEHGHGILSEDGKCIILLDTIENQYYITLTKYGQGDIYIFQKDSNSFIVTGTPNLEFDWQVTAA